MFFAVARVFARGEQVDDVVKWLLYRPVQLGGPAWFDLLRSALRGPSEWTPGQREMFAAATSAGNSCRFCADIHSRTAGMMSGRQLEPANLPSGDGVDLTPQEQAMLRLIERVSSDPEGVTPDDVDAVRTAGVSDAAIADALTIVFLFDVINRCVDAFGCSWDSDRHRSMGARSIVRFGYRIPRPLMR